MSMVCIESGETYPTQVGAPPAAKPKTPARKSVMLNAGRRPMTSDARPQNEAPRQRPKNKAQVVKRTREEDTSNSMDSWGKVSATP